MGRALLAFMVVQEMAAQTANPNYPEPLARPMWCAVPNYRFYRVTPTKARGFANSDSSQCSLTEGKPDDCQCGSSDECRSEYCVPNEHGVGMCTYPIIQVAEVEFWRAGRKIDTAKIADDHHDAFRVRNGVDVQRVWGIWELEFYHDTQCTNRISGGTAIASSERMRGFGHSIDHTAPLGLHDTARTYWQATHEPPLEQFELHGPSRFAFDGDIRTNWWPTCENPCRARTEWLGLDFGAIVPGGMKCVRIMQDKDRDYAAFHLIVEAHQRNGTWDPFAAFNAATWNHGGVWETLSIPQGVSFHIGRAHGYTMDLDLNSSVVQLVGQSLDYDFGVETEIDSWRWATAEEPTENTDMEHDGFTCDRDGYCPRDIVQWTLEGSLDNITWQTLQTQDTTYPVSVYRKRFVPFQSVLHRVSLSIEDIWPDGRGRCASRR